MARKRSIKPEFFEDEKISSLSPWARLLYIGIWCQADANGAFDANIRLIKARIFPLESFSENEVSGFLEELTNQRLVISVIENEKKFIYVPSFRKHQKIHHDEPIRFKIPDTIPEVIETPHKEAVEPPKSAHNFPFPSASASASVYTSEPIPKFGRTLEKQEIETFTQTIKTNLNITAPLGRGLTANFLKCFESLSEAEDWLSPVFQRALAKFSDDEKQAFEYIKGAMFHHHKAERAAFDGN